MNNSGYQKKKAASMSFGGRSKNSGSLRSVNNFYNISDIHTISITSFDKVEDVSPHKSIKNRTERSITCTGSV